MKSSRLLIVLLAICFVAAVPRISGASSLAVAEWGVGEFNSIYSESSDPVFISPGIDNFLEFDQVTPVAGWTGAFVSGQSVEAWGVNRVELLWNMHFSESYADAPFVFDVYVYLDTTLVDWATITYNGGLNGSFNGSNLSNWDNYSIFTHNLDTVPEPSTLLLLGLGLLGLIPLRKKTA